MRRPPSAAIAMGNGCDRDACLGDSDSATDCGDAVDGAPAAINVPQDGRCHKHLGEAVRENMNRKRCEFPFQTCGYAT
jgi:hypothetical protein